MCGVDVYFKILTCRIKKEKEVGFLFDLLRNCSLATKHQPGKPSKSSITKEKMSKISLNG